MKRLLRPGRGTKRVRSYSPTDGEAAPNEDDGLSPRERRRRKNKESAAQSRRRKREQLERMRKRVRDLTRKHNAALGTIRSLQAEVATLNQTIESLQEDVAVLTAELDERRRQDVGAAL